MGNFKFNPFTDKLDVTGNSGGGGGGVATLEGNTGGPIPPDGSGNIHVVGTGAITVSGAGNTLTISSGNPFFTWHVVNSNTVMVAQNGYFSNGGGRINHTLPSPSSLGDVVAVTDIGGNGWRILGSGAEQIRLGNQISTSLTGYIESNNNGDGVVLVCAVADTLWVEAQGGIQGASITVV